MKHLVLLMSVTSCLTCGECTHFGDLTDAPANLTDPTINLTDSSTNLTGPAKDMYVIRATVYQIGILTNRTENATDDFNSTTGNQESVTLYHTNGTNVDLSTIPEPFLTNVTAQTLVGVAPIPDNHSRNSLDAWGAFSQMSHPKLSADKTRERRKKSVDSYIDILRLFKRDTTVRTSSTPVRVVNGAALIPPEAGIQSISLPPLLSLNNNLTEIPVPIPNTSVVHYAKVNALIQKP